MTAAWSHIVRLGDVGRGPVRVSLEAGPRERLAIARELAVERLDSLTAELLLKPWLDGAELEGRLLATLTQTCSVSGDPLDQTIQADFTVRMVPAGSAAAPQTESEEIEIDPDSDDPPDVLERDEVDLAAYVVEHLALEIDPFPRKPGAVFEPPAETGEVSPFAVLARLKDGKKAE